MLPTPKGWKGCSAAAKDCATKGAAACDTNPLCHSISMQDNYLSGNARVTWFAGGGTALRPNRAWTTWVKNAKISQYESSMAELPLSELPARAPPPPGPIPPVLRICGAAKGIRVGHMTFAAADHQDSPAVVVTKSCAASTTGTGLPPPPPTSPTSLPSSGVQELSDELPTQPRAPGPKAYRPPNRVNAKEVGTGLSVSFHHTFTYGGDYFFANPVLVEGLSKGDLVNMEAHMGPVNITNSGDAVVIFGFHYGGPTTVTGPIGAGFVGELFRLTAGTYEQALIHGSNAYAVADWYHEGCQYTLLPALDSAIVVVSLTKVCTPYTSPMPMVRTDEFDGLFYMESPSAAYSAFNVTGKGGTGDVVMMGASFWTPSSTFAVTGAAMTALGSFSNSGGMVSDGSCYPGNKTVPNAGLPQCVLPDIIPPKMTVSDSLVLVAQAHDYIRALGEYDIAINHPELAASA